MKKITLLVTTLGAALFPVLAFAQVIQNPQSRATGQNVGDIFTIVEGLANRSIGILVTIALAVFFYGLVRYLFKLGGEKGAENGRNLMVYGIIALFVMVSIWGIITFIGNFFAINGANPVETTRLIPTVNGTRIQ